MRRVNILPCAIVLIGTISVAHAWEVGHFDQTLQIYEHLPEELHEAYLAEDVPIGRWGKYLDSLAPNDPEKVGGASVMKTLAAHGINRRYDLHLDLPRAVAFCLLVDALREKRMRHALFWIACLGHSAGDAAAPNHDPLAQTLHYHWAAEAFEARLTPEQPLGPLSAMLDLHWTASSDGGKEVFRAQTCGVRGLGAGGS